MEFQFVSAKVDNDNTISVPWKSRTDSQAETSSASSESAIGQRIDLIRKNLATQPPSATNPSKPNLKNKRKASVTKISEISKSLLSQNDSDKEKIDNDDEIVEIEINENSDENIDDNEEKDDTPKVSTRRKRRRSNKT